MLNAINTKLLIAILAVLTAIGSAAIYQRYESTEAAEAAAKSAAILQQQQKEAEEQREHDEAFRKTVEQNKARHNSAAAHEDKTWKTYLP